MLIQHKDSYLQSSILLTSKVFHAYSVRSLGDMRRSEAKDSFLRFFGLSGDNLALGEQVHGALVAETTLYPSEVAGADGLIAVGQTGKVVAVVVADCVPILFADGENAIVAAVHAGWRGTIAGIATNAIKKMTDRGAVLKNIRVSIGPHIGRCCYAVPRERGLLFQKKYHGDDRVAGENNGTWYLDIGLANKTELLDAGLSDAQIDAPIVCTSCQIDRFFSFRKDTKETFGEIIAVIGVQ